MDTKLILGIEGGGTKTGWVYYRALENQTELLQSGKLPAANLRLITDVALLEMLRHLPQDATNVGLYLAGCITEEDRARTRKIARESWPHAAIAVGSDRDSGYAAAFGNEDGILVMAGTGAAVTGRKDGRQEKAGGRGHLLGDRGGAYVVCIEGLRLVLRIYDLQHRTTKLAKSILRALALNRMEDLVGWTQAADKMSISSLAPVMFAAAENGDRKIFAILRAASKTLAHYTASVSRWLKYPSPQVKLTGGLFVHQPLYAELFTQALHPLLPSATVAVIFSSGAEGAARLAAEGAKISLTPERKTTAHPEIANAATEKQNPRSMNLDSLDTAELIELFLAEESHVVEALRSCSRELRDAIELITSVLNNGGNLFYIGAGTSGRLGVLDASEIPPTFGESPERVQGIIAGGQTALYKSVEGAEDNELEGALAIQDRGVTKRDVVCGITASGCTPFVISALKRAKKIGAKTILLSCNPDGSNHFVCDVRIELPTGPELLTGSTRLKAGTATKVALNILSTCSMIRLGKVKGNFMIDLTPTNAKLRDRAARIYAQLKGTSIEEAHQVLSQHNWNIRKALELS